MEWRSGARVALMIVASLLLASLQVTSGQEGSKRTDQAAVQILDRVQSDDLLGASRMGGSSVIFAVGNHGAIVRYDGSSGSLATLTRSTGLPLRAIAFQPGTTRALVVGGGGHAWWMQSNGSMSGLPTGTTMELYDVDWVSSGTAIIVGGTIPIDDRPGEGLVLRFDATSSNFTRLPTPSVHTQLYRYGSSPGGEVGYAVGLDHTVLRISGDSTDLVQHDRTQFPADILNGVAFRNDGRPFFCGSSGTVLTLDGNGRTTVVVTGTPNRLFDIIWDPTSDTGLLMADSGLILRYNGAVPSIRDVSFSVVSTHGNFNNLFSASFGPDGAWALIVGAKGTLARWPDATSTTTAPYDNTVVYLVIGTVITALVVLVVLRLRDAVHTEELADAAKGRRSGRSGKRAARRSGVSRSGPRRR